MDAKAPAVATIMKGRTRTETCEPGELRFGAARQVLTSAPRPGARADRAGRGSPPAGYLRQAGRLLRPARRASCLGRWCGNARTDRRAIQWTSPGTDRRLAVPGAPLGRRPAGRRIAGRGGRPARDNPRRRQCPMGPDGRGWLDGKSVGRRARPACSPRRVRTDAFPGRRQSPRSRSEEHFRGADGVLMAVGWDAAGPVGAVHEAVGLALDWSKAEPSFLPMPSGRTSGSAESSSRRSHGCSRDGWPLRANGSTTTRQTEATHRWLPPR
jgi:hypothetical protein